MATVTDVEVANASFPNVRQDLNDILEALATNFSADAEPTTTYPNQFWYETDSNLLYIRNEADDAWITLALINQTSGEWEVRTGVIQAVDSAGVVIKTDDGTTRISVSDAGVVSFENYSFPTADGSNGQALITDGSGSLSFGSAGITEADQFRVTANATISTSTVLDSNWERVDSSGFGKIGTGMSESSGIFTFPSTGYWFVSFNPSVFKNGDVRNCSFKIEFTSDNTNYTSVAAADLSVVRAETSNTHACGDCKYIFDITNTTLQKVRFTASTATTSYTLYANTNTNLTYVTFIRLGDT